MEIAKSSPSGLQEPVGSEHRVEQLVEYFIALPFEDQKSLLLVAASDIVPRLQDLTADEFIASLRRVPIGDGKLGTSEHEEQAETRDEVYEEWMRQSMGAQKHILELVAPRVLVNLRWPERDQYLLQLGQVIGEVENGGLPPTLH